ncbi:unnamed protein product [Paramecium primaurelia]|uniref:DNA/RNA-binding protein Alba-like domain-containing protein n=2 Tax=Paramecium TaxID=5884 RepID=A0A8S1UFF4_9CILI|nr:unnamed protein product [Paramecium primaurelia]CAD8163124.1 unnamed protein product [Paramecium pentaurelia]
MNQQKTELDPKDQILNISKNKAVGQYIFLSKIFLNKFGQLSLHALGDATKNVISIAQALERKKYAKIIKIETQTFIPNEQPGGKKIKLIAQLEVTEEGKKLIIEELEKRRKPEQVAQDINQ